MPTAMPQAVKFALIVRAVACGDAVGGEIRTICASEISQWLVKLVLRLVKLPPVAAVEVEFDLFFGVVLWGWWLGRGVGYIPVRSEERSDVAIHRFEAGRGWVMKALRS